MTQDELNQNFETLRQAVVDEMKKPQNQNDEAIKMAGFVVLGVEILHSALGDLKRIADAMESIADSELHRIASSLEGLEANDDSRLDQERISRLHE